MGVLDKIGKILRGQQNKEKGQMRKHLYSRQIQNSEDEIMAFNIDIINSVKHRDNEITDLVMARLTKRNPKDTIYVDLADYVAFEIPKGIEINDEIMNLVMEQYEKQAQTKNEAQQYYFGRLINDRNRYELGNKNATVENIVKETVQKILQQKKEQQERKKQEEIRKEEQFQESLNARKYMEDMQNER